MKNSKRSLLSLPLILPISLLAAPAIAQNADPLIGEAEVREEAVGDGGMIIVTGVIPGSVDTDIAAVDELNQEDIAAYGANSVGDLITALSPQIGSGRGRGGGRPIMLLNGRPVNDHREVFRLPPEAIRKVEIFPEELALKFGYRPDQRVVNLILVPNYASAELQAEVGAPEHGGYWHQEYEAKFTRLGEISRFNANVQYDHQGALTEGELGVLNPRTGGVDANFRTVKPRSSNMEASANWARKISETGDFTLSGSYAVSDNERLNGLQAVDITVAANNPFNTSGAVISLSPLLVSEGALTRDSTSETLNFNAGANGRTGDWSWRVSSSLTKNKDTSVTQRGLDDSVLQSLVTNGTLNPFANPASFSAPYLSPNRSQSKTLTLDSTANMSGPLFSLPAGAVQLSITADGNYDRIVSSAITEDSASNARLSRSTYGGSFNIDIPLTERLVGLGGIIGRLSINANGGYKDLNDFGGLYSYGGGINWGPADNLDVNVSYIGEEAAPSLSSLGAPTLISPNVTLYDYTNGESVLVDYITGGNPDLLKEKRRDWKFTVNWKMPIDPEVRLTGEFLRNRSSNVTASFPTLTPDVEAAFAGRVTRDGAGRLIAVDARPVTYEATRSDSLKFTLSHSAQLGKNPDEGGEDRAGRRERGGGGGGPPPFGRRDKNSGRYFISAGYSYQLKDEIQIASGLPILDLLNGDATGSSGGTSRHKVTMESGVFMGGKGLRISGKYQSGSRVDGDILTGSDTLNFGSLVTLDARLFINLGEQDALVEKMPFLKGWSTSVRVENIFNSYQKVENQLGETPLAYQRGYQQPVGRYFELDFRKRF